MTQPNDVRAVVNQVQQNGVRLVRFLYCDNGGIIRGKAVGKQVLAERLDGGIGMPVAIQAMNSLDQLQMIDGMGVVGEIRLRPDPRTFRIIPYAPNSALLLCDMFTHEGLFWEACPRGFLRRQVERSYSDADMIISTAFEPEWVLARRNNEGGYTAIDDSLAYSTLGMTVPATLIDEIVGGLESQNLRVEQYVSEKGHGQQEISISHAAALEAADNQIVYRETIRSIAWNQGYIASFAPKPFAGQPGNGCHIHLSAWDGKNPTSNLFYDPSDQYQLSEKAYFFIGGILAHLPGLTALTCASVNSYRRLRPLSWASAYSCYGYDNREAAIRIPSPLGGREPETVNIEIKAADNTANPYIALGGIIAAGLDGVKNKIHPGDKQLVNSDPSLIPETERQARGIVRLPESLRAALDALEQDDVLLSAMGEMLARSYLEVKRSEVAAYSIQGEIYEINQHFFKY
jgi:glutamine synthetase